MTTGDEPQRSDAPSPSYLDEQGRYRDDQPRPDPIDSGDAIATLLGFLERQRATFAWKCGGLDATSLRATLAPSSLTLGGMLKHLARFEDDMSTEWLLGREQLPPWNAIDWTTNHDWDWRSAATDTPDQLYTLWQTAVTRSRSLFAQALSSPSPERQTLVSRGQAPSLLYILTNMIEEYARHNGHADLIRESIDNLTGHDPPD